MKAWRFIHTPILRIGRRFQWVLESELVYATSLCNDLIIVPTGFETDLASIPNWVPRWIADPTGDSRLPAIVHDYLCRAWPLNQRDLADRIFLEAMAECGVSRWRRTVMYCAVAGLTQWLKLTKRNGNE